MTERLDALGVILTDSHFKYSSGRHGSRYFAKEILFEHPQELSWVARELAARYGGIEFDVVVGPESGGALLAYEVARHLSTPEREVLAIPAKKVEIPALTHEDAGTNLLFDRLIQLEVGEVMYRRKPYFAFRPGAEEKIRDKRVLVLDDTVDSGTTLKRVERLVVDTGGMVMGMSAICSFAKDADTSLTTLLDLPSDSWDPSECPLCSQGIPLREDFAHGRVKITQRPSTGRWADLTPKVAS